MVNCSICKNKITRDRYNISFILERQDFPPKGSWQKSVDRYKADVCPSCSEVIQRKIHQLWLLIDGGF